MKLLNVSRKCIKLLTAFINFLRASVEVTEVIQSFPNVRHIIQNFVETCWVAYVLQNLSYFPLSFVKDD